MPTCFAGEFGRDLTRLVGPPFTLWTASASIPSSSDCVLGSVKGLDALLIDRMDGCSCGDGVSPMLLLLLRLDSRAFSLGFDDMSRVLESGLSEWGRVSMEG